MPIIESVFTTLSGVTGKCSLPVSSPISKTQHDGINKLQLALKSNYTLAELLQYIIVLSFMADSPVGTGVYANVSDRSQFHCPTSPDVVKTTFVTPQSSHQSCDVLVVGAGVVGCAVTRKLALEGARVILADKERDILGGASKAKQRDSAYRI